MTTLRPDSRRGNEIGEGLARSGAGLADQRAALSRVSRPPAPSRPAAAGTRSRSPGGPGGPPGPRKSSTASIGGQRGRLPKASGSRPPTRSQSSRPMILKRATDRAPALCAAAARLRREVLEVRPIGFVDLVGFIALVHEHEDDTVPFLAELQLADPLPALLLVEDGPGLDLDALVAAGGIDGVVATLRPLSGAAPARAAAPHRIRRSRC